MKTLEKLRKDLTSIPIATSWHLSALDEFKGKQELYSKQSPQKLKHLKEHALIESSISSNRMEGVKESKIYLKKAIDLWKEEIKEKRIPPLILLIAFNFDFLCIHPFRDGNRRVSRLILLLQLYKLGFHIGKFSVADIKYNLPGVSIELIRKVLKALQKEKKVKNTGRGRNARWEKV